jgi:hypothetical protein
MTQFVLDFSNEDDAMIQRMATEAVESGEFSNWDHAYESLWHVFEQETTE